MVILILINLSEMQIHLLPIIHLNSTSSLNLNMLKNIMYMIKILSLLKLALSMKMVKLIMKNWSQRGIYDRTHYK